MRDATCSAERSAWRCVRPFRDLLAIMWPSLAVLLLPAVAAQASKFGSKPNILMVVVDGAISAAPCSLDFSAALLRSGFRSALLSTLASTR